MTLQWTLSFLDAIYQVEILILALREQYTMNICYKKFILRKTISIKIFIMYFYISYRMSNIYNFSQCMNYKTIFYKCA